MSGRALVILVGEGECEYLGVSEWCVLQLALRGHRMEPCPGLSGAPAEAERLFYFYSILDLDSAQDRPSPSKQQGTREKIASTEYNRQQ